MDIRDDYICKKISAEKGFSLAEVMATIALIGILGAMIAGLIPVIRNVMNRITMVARSEILLSNTVTVLRDYLRYADDVIGSDNTYRFTGGDNWIYEISTDSENHGWITITPIAPSGNALEIDTENSTVTDWRILTANSASEQLVPTFESISYSNGTFTISGLTIISSKEEDNEKVYATYKDENRNAIDLTIRSVCGDQEEEVSDD